MDGMYEGGGEEVIEIKPWQDASLLSPVNGFRKYTCE